MRPDLRDATCSECGFRCVPGQTHLQHSNGWNKKISLITLVEVIHNKWSGWDLVERRGEDPSPARVELRIQNGSGKSSHNISVEFDDLATGMFYSEDHPDDGHVFVYEGEWYSAMFTFQKREDAYAFICKYGGQGR